MSNYKIFIVCYLFLCLSLYAQDSEVNVTLWAHGTHPLQRLISSKHSPLHERVYIQQGLSLAKDLPEKYDFAQIARMCYKHNPEEYDLDHFYTYGWRSGNLFAYHRRNVGKQLHEELEKLIQQYRDNGKKVKLRLVGFSHGSNVVLNCIRHLQHKSDVEIEVILVAPPVEEETKEHLNNPAIDRVYALYSEDDWVQTKSLQKFRAGVKKSLPWFSQRTFDGSDNVTHVRVKVDGKAPGHFSFRPVLMNLSKIMGEVKEQLKQDTNSKQVEINYRDK